MYFKAAHTFLNSDYFKKCDVKWSIFHDDDAFVNYPKFESIIDHDSKPKVGSDLIPDPALYCMWNGIKPQLPMRFSKYKGDLVIFLIKNNVFQHTYHVRYVKNDFRTDFRFSVAK